MKCKIPIRAYVDSGKLKIFHNGESRFVNLPFRPFIFMKVDVKSQHKYNYVLIEEERILFSSKKKEVVYKYCFRNFKDYYEFKKNYESMIIYHSNYINSVFTVKPDFFLSYPQEEDLKILAFDIECRTIGDGLMANAMMHEILAIGCKFMKGDTEVYRLFSTESQSEVEMLLEFKTAFVNFDPDIITGYNIKRFDLPYIVQRLRVTGINESFLRREKNIPVDLSVEGSWSKNHTDINVKFELFGRCVYDLYVQCGRDNKLRKLRNLKLTTVATYFNIPDISLDKSIITDLNKFVNNGGWPHLKDYLRNDVLQVEEILKIYLSGRIDIAEIMKVPLDYCLNDYPAFVPDVYTSREMWYMGYLGDTKNSERYAEITTYEGANVEFNEKNKGLHKPIKHVDFSSMYPNIIMSYNLSPETIELVEIKPEYNEFKFIDLGDKLEIHMLDKKIKPYPCTVVIRVQKADGVLRKMLHTIYTERLKYKKLYRESMDSGMTNEKLNSLQNIYKLILNTTYGYNGARFCRWGDMLVAAATTAIGRYLVARVRDYLGEDNWIEVDTDGIWCKELPDMKELNKFLNKIVSEEHHCSFSQMAMDSEIEEAGYFYKMKNYIIRSHGKLQFTGCSFVNRKMPLFIQKTYEKIVHDVIDGKSKIEVVREFLDFDKYELSQFSMNTKLMRHESMYASDNSVNKKLIQQLKSKNIHVSFGMQVSYYKTLNGYEVEELVVSKAQLDLKYYAEQAEKLLERLDLANSRELKVLMPKLVRMKKNESSLPLTGWLN